MGNNFYLELTQKLGAAQKILLTTHIVPDADGLGSQIALCHALRLMGKEVYCVNEEELLARYDYLDPNGFIISLQQFQLQHPQFEPDLVAVIDTNKMPRTGLKMSQFLQRFAHQVIFLDHHPYEKLQPGVHYIDTEAAATGEITGRLIKELGIAFDHTIGLALYTAILIDTNSFRYPTVTYKTHQLIAELMETGVTSVEAYNNIYGTKKLSHMHLLGHILKNCKVNEKNNIAWICINESEFSQYNSEIEDTHAYINNLLTLDGVRIACMFREDGRKLKLSLRSHGDIDVGEIASQLGGGGHAHSAATVIEVPPGQDKDIYIKNCIEKLEEILSHLS